MMKGKNIRCYESTEEKGVTYSELGGSMKTSLRVVYFIWDLVIKQQLTEWIR